MNLTLSRKAVVIAAVAAASMFVLAPAAQAQDDSYGAAACLVAGAAGTATNGGVDSVLTDLGTDATAWDPANLLDTDSGTFEFDSSTVACAAVDVAGSSPGLAAGPNYSIVAGTNSPGGVGNYTNLICGTGHAQGTATLSRGATTNLNTRFSVDFVGGTGPITISEVSGTAQLDAAPLGGPSVQTVETGTGAGVVNILPTGHSNQPNAVAGCIDGDVTEFTVSSAFVATLSGDA